MKRNEDKVDRDARIILRENEIRIIRVLFSNTTLDIKSSSNISNSFDTNVGSPQGDDLSGCLFIIYLEKAPRTLRDQVDNNHVTGEHSYSVQKVPDQMSASMLMTQICSTTVERRRKDSCS